jgi:hypothetical protein
MADLRALTKKERQAYREGFQHAVIWIREAARNKLLCQCGKNALNELAGKMGSQERFWVEKEDDGEGNL